MYNDERVAWDVGKTADHTIYRPTPSSIPALILFFLVYVFTCFLSQVYGADGQGGRYIVASTPLSGAEEGKVSTQYGFWRMVVETGVVVIVMMEG